MQRRFIALFVLTLFVFSCDQDRPTAQVDSSPADLDESLTTIEVNGAVFRRVAAKAVSTAQGGDMSIVLNYSMAGSKASIASVTIDGVTFLSSACDPSTQRGIVELVTDNAITPSTDFESRTQLELPEIEDVGGAIWKHFGPYKLDAGATHYFELSVGPGSETEIISLSDDMGLRGQTLLSDGEPWAEEISGNGPGENFVLGHGNVGDSGTNTLFKISGANSTTEGTYTLLVQSVRNYEELEEDVGDSRSTAFETPFPPFLFDDFALIYYGPSRLNLNLTEGDTDYFVIDVPQKVTLYAGFTTLDENGIVNPSIKLVRSNRRIAASGSNQISRTIDAGKYWIKIEGDPPAGQEEGRYRLSYYAHPASE